MSAAVFTPDPLLARKAPTPRTGFGVVSLLASKVPVFQPDPVMSPGGDGAAWPALGSADSGSSAGPGGVEEPSFQALPGWTGGSPEPADAGTDAAAVQAHAVAGEGLEGAAMDPQASGATLGADGAAMLGEHAQALLEQRYRDGFEDGLAQGARLAEAAQAEVPVGAAPADAVLLLESLSRALAPLLLPDDAATRFEPLKRLALHLAMELVRTELSVSPRAVDQLVRRSVQALQAAETTPVVVELNPRDLVLLKELWENPAATSDAALLQRVKWVEDPQLTRGSVRARSDVSSVEDLIQQRLASIIQDLRIQAVQWQRDEAVLQERLEAGADAHSKADSEADSETPQGRGDA